jgi:uncharacterized membrane protein YedE/YeeE
VKTLAVALGSGLLFGAGLTLSGMTDPRRIQAFLALTQGWDPSLLGVMGAAVLVHVLVLRLDARRTRSEESVAPRGSVDWRLVTGAAIFGVGWGLTGYCPGPAVVGVGAGQTAAIVFIIAMLAGIAAYHLLWVRAADRGRAGGDAEWSPPNLPDASR